MCFTEQRPKAYGQSSRLLRECRNVEKAVGKAVNTRKEEKKLLCPPLWLKISFFWTSYLRSLKEQRGERSSSQTKRQTEGAAVTASARAIT
ncbi:hypothetical protein MHYP_G00006970 [Metynnis hypsauchen]